VAPSRTPGATPEKWGIRCFTDTLPGGSRPPAKRYYSVSSCWAFLKCFRVGPTLTLLLLTPGAAASLSHLPNPNPQFQSLIPQSSPKFTNPNPQFLHILVLSSFSLITTPFSPGAVVHTPHISHSSRLIQPSLATLTLAFKIQVNLFVFFSLFMECLILVLLNNPFLTHLISFLCFDYRYYCLYLCLKARVCCYWAAIVFFFLLFVVLARPPRAMAALFCSAR